MNAKFEQDAEVAMDAQEMETELDLNLADAAELATVPGIGPTLASRIVAYREEHGPFLLPEEVTAVSGIGSATYENMRAQVTATLPEELPPPQGKTETERETAMIEETPEEQEATLITPPPEEEKAKTTDEEMEARPALNESAAALGPALPPPEREREPEPRRQPEPAETSTSPPSRRQPAINQKLWITGVLAAFAGGLLGMLFALLVFAGLNGSLDLNQTEVVVGLRTQLESVTRDVDTLDQDVDDLRERLNALEGLTTRMDEAEATLETLEDDVATLDENVGVLQEETLDLREDVEILSDDLEAVTEDVERATTFFERLRGLLIDVFGEEPESATPESEE